MRSMVRALLTAALVFGAAATLQAQRYEQRREGFWAAIGVGYGSAGSSCDGCGSRDRDWGFTTHVRLGTTLNPRLLLGADATLWNGSSGDVNRVMGGVSATLLFYPVVTSGFFLRGAVGYSLYAHSPDLIGDGSGIELGIGYDIRVTRGWSFTVFSDFLFGSLDEIQNNEGVNVERGFTQNMIHAGIGFTYH